jgi:hypothetical protein
MTLLSRIPQKLQIYFRRFFVKKPKIGLSITAFGWVKDGSFGKGIIFSFQTTETLENGFRRMPPSIAPEARFFGDPILLVMTISCLSEWI